MSKVKGFTLGQRKFFLDVFGHRCAFYTKVGTRWVRCVRTKRLEVHHIIPRGWAAMNMKQGFDINGIEQGIVLCRDHHWRVHPDMYPTMEAYRGGNRSAFNELMKARRRKNLLGVPYWDTTWDLMFVRLNRRFVGRYTATRKVKYPKRRVPK